MTNPLTAGMERERKELKGIKSMKEVRAGRFHAAIIVAFLLIF